MRGFVEWATDVLVSRGALVESGTDDTLRAMLSPELAGVLHADEWLSLRFSGGYPDDESDWLDRFGRLLPAGATVAGARLRRLATVRPVDSAAVLDRELVIHNGIWRSAEDYQETARYYFFTFEYGIESDETTLGYSTVCINASAGSLVVQPESLLEAIRDDLEDDPEFLPDREEVARTLPVALRRVRGEVRRLAIPVENTANRRLARDSGRVHVYYRDLLRQIEKRIAKHAGDPQAAEKEHSRAAATRLDCAAKLDDLARRYSLKIRVEPGDVLAVSLPVRAISARVIRKKTERMARFHWNPRISALDSPWCEGCLDRAHPLFLCDDRAHFLCGTCAPACPACRRPPGRKP